MDEAVWRYDVLESYVSDDIVTNRGLRTVAVFSRIEGKECVRSDHCQASVSPFEEISRSPG